MNLGITKSQFERATEDFRAMSGTPDLVVEFEDGLFRCLGSELSILRLAVRYEGNPKARHSYSSNLQTWYFTLQTSFSGSMSTEK